MYEDGSQLEASIIPQINNNKNYLIAHIDSPLAVDIFYRANKIISLCLNSPLLREALLIRALYI